MKEKFINFFMRVAEETATLSYASRLKVGAVIVKDKNIISFGYNGTPEGFDNSCEEKINENGTSYQLVTKKEVIHAEANAITKLARQGGRGEGSTLFITHAPCIECSKLIIQSGIKSVFYKSPYRLEDGINLLHRANIQTFKTE